MSTFHTLINCRNLLVFERDTLTFSFRVHFDDHSSSQFLDIFPLVIKIMLLDTCTWRFSYSVGGAFIGFSFTFNRNLSRNLQTSKAPLKSQAQGTSSFTSAASNQIGCPKDSQL